MSWIDNIREVTQQLYPTGRAFKQPVDGVMDKVHKALAETENQAYLDSHSIFDSILPDNANFSADDATDWEIRLGMITNTALPLADRKSAILRKMRHTGSLRARQAAVYIERELHSANFSTCFVHENLTGQSPIDYYSSGNPTSLSEYGLFEFGTNEFGTTPQNIMMMVTEYGQFQYGQLQYGYNWNGDFLIANRINPLGDQNFDVGTSFRSSFFIGGPTFGSFANVTASRESEFRQLVLKLKPANTVAFIFINYI
jgi:hypothetical protein|tara:strand:- start:540 stop:1307 length:768 start_codon:yes stop_codon:yes gene_type:complete